MARDQQNQILTTLKRWYYRNMAATLNQDDINLLKSIFATKDDLGSMEKRQDAKYATKAELKIGFSNIEKRFDDMDMALTKYSQDIETRIERLEVAVGIPAVN